MKDNLIEFERELHKPKKKIDYVLLGLEFSRFLIAITLLIFCPDLPRKIMSAMLVLLTGYLTIKTLTK